MEIVRIENLSFTYPDRKEKTLDDITLSVCRGEFITLCGKSGCGKTTLLRLLKSPLAPAGVLHGNIYFDSRPLSEVDIKTQAEKIGFVMQSPENQIVTDKVWHELAFGLESLGVPTPEIRGKVAEMASFFGIENWFYKKVTELSGGQKQLLNLASVMVMQPQVLILDEPTSQLDPIAAQEFLKTLEKINRELGVSVILTEHRLEEAFPISDRVIVLDKGKILADDTPENVGKILKDAKHDMKDALPAPVRIWSAVNNDLDCPLTVREGRVWLEKYSQNNLLKPDLIPEDSKTSVAETAIEIKDAWFRYEKNLPDVIKGLNVKINKGELFSILGGNGVGKTTMLSLISGLLTPYRGEIFIKDKKLSEIKNLHGGILGVLPQNPQSLFVKKTVFLDLLEILEDQKISKEEKEQRVTDIARLCRIDDLLKYHPYDLSGGEQQRAALAKVLLMSPEILLLDEPTKGMDVHFKKIFADILKDLKAGGVTVVMVSHDLEFCAQISDRCALVFDGSFVSTDTPREFFAGKSFYTTLANRMARTCLPKAILAEDIIFACGGNIEKNKKSSLNINLSKPQSEICEEKPKAKKPSPIKIITGCIFACLFLLTCVYGLDLYTDWQNQAVQLLTFVELGAALVCFLPKRKYEILVAQPQRKQKLTKRTLLAMLFALLLVPLTIFVGVFYFGDRKYYFISLLIILETLIPFGMTFESRKPQARELIIISVLCAIAVAGRSAFFMIPQFKPVVAVVIIAGVCFGGETGFLVGAISGFVSNFFFGQSPLTPWQMFGFGIIGFIAGALFKKGFLRRTKLSLCIFGFLATFVIYGVILNSATIILWEPKPTFEMIISACALGLPFDLIHAASTVFFLWFAAEPMIEKLERVKVKYGLI